MINIGDSAFYYTTGLTSINLPNSLVSIGDSAFMGCSGLVSVNNIPNTLTTIANKAFGSCKNLSAFEFPNSITSIGESAFGSCSKITSVTIPNSVTTIGKSTFLSCTSLNSVTIPNSVTKIGVTAFSGCKALTSITIPDSVISIDASAFFNVGFTYLTIPKSVEYIGAKAFSGTLFSNVTFEGEMPTISDDSFKSMSMSVDDSKPDSKVTIDIKGYVNGKSISDEKIWVGELLKPEVSGYNGTDELYYRFETGNSNADIAISFYTSDTRRQLDGFKMGYVKGEGYAAILSDYPPTYIKCSVYTWDDTNKKMILVNSKTVNLTSSNFITNHKDAIDREFANDAVYIMHQGDTATLAEILANAGFTHITCTASYFENIATSKYSGNEYLSINGISGGDKNTTIVASTKHTGLSVVNFDYYSDKCSYHGTTYSSTEPKKCTILIYVLPNPEFDVTKDSITVIDNTPSPGTSTYQIGFGETATEFTDLKDNTEYDVLQTVSLPIGAKTYTGVYHNYVSTKKAYAITNLTTEAESTTNNGYITVDEKAAEGETVNVTPVPNSGYMNVSITAYKTGDPKTKVEVKDNSFTMPAYDVTVCATFEKSYNVTIDSSIIGGTVTANPISGTSGTEIGLTVIPDTENGYYFKSLTVTKSKGGTVEYDSNYKFSMPEDDVTVSAVFSNQYTVTFNPDNGSNTTEKDVTYNNKVTMDDPERIGSIFKGWYDGDELFDIATTPITEDVELIAIWATKQTDEPVPVDPEGTMYTQVHTISEKDEINGVIDEVKDYLLEKQLDDPTIVRGFLDPNLKIVDYSGSEGQEKIKEASKGKNIDYLDAYVLQYYAKQGEEFVADGRRSVTDNVFEFVYHYDMTGKVPGSIGVLRYHEGDSADEYQLLDSRPTSSTEWQDLTYFVEGEGADTVIYFYSQKFSDNAVTSLSQPKEITSQKYYASLTLNDTLDLNFKAEFEGTEEFDTKLVSVKVVKGDEELTPELKFTKVGEKFVAEVKQITNVASNQMANNIEIYVSYNGKAISRIDYSVEKYCNKVLSVGTYNEKNLVRAVMNYGYEVQQAFGLEDNTPVSKTWHLDLSGLAMPDTSELNYNKTDKVTGLSANLTLGSAVSLNITVSGDSITEDDVKITNQKGERVPEDRIKVEGNVITVSNISAHKLSNTYRFEILDTNVFYGVGTYCGNMKGDATVGNVCYAIYYYSQMADACTY